ncbi:MAG: tetratricopeptide repeat protein, partial [Ktedonobacterales bacterium]
SEIAASLNNLAAVADQHGRHAEAEELLRECLAIHRRLGEPWGEVFALCNLAEVACEQAAYAQATALVEEGLAIARRWGSLSATAYTVGMLGYISYSRSDYTEAARRWGESLALRREQGDRYSIAFCLLRLAIIAREQTHYSSALALYHESLTLYASLAVTKGAVECLEGIACVAALTGQAACEAWLCGAAMALRESIGVPHELRDTAYIRAGALAQQTPEDANFMAAWEASHELSLDLVIRHALPRIAELVARCEALPYPHQNAMAMMT